MSNLPEIITETSKLWRKMDAGKDATRGYLYDSKGEHVSKKTLKPTAFTWMVSICLVLAGSIMIYYGIRFILSDYHLGNLIIWVLSTLIFIIQCNTFKMEKRSRYKLYELYRERANMTEPEEIWNCHFPLTDDRKNMLHSVLWCRLLYRILAEYTTVPLGNETLERRLGYLAHHLCTVSENKEIDPFIIEEIEIHCNRSSALIGEYTAVIELQQELAGLHLDKDK